MTMGVENRQEEGWNNKREKRRRGVEVEDSSNNREGRRREV